MIGVVTSGDGAAIHDIVTVAFRRGSPRILLARAIVQGPGAAASMVRALDTLGRVAEVEVIILGRGGGSADDLAAYNDEALVRKVASMSVPIVSAVGHEVDTTLTDLVADARAATPSQAAEMLVADRVARRQQLVQLFVRMRRAVRQDLTERRSLLERLERTIGSPAGLVAERQQRLDEAEMRLGRAMERALARRQAELGKLERRLSARHPRAVVAAARAGLGPLEVRLLAAQKRRMERLRTTLARHAARLSALSPLAVLGRGYAIATTDAGLAVRDAGEVAIGDSVHVRVSKGSFVAVVSDVSGAVSDPIGGPENNEGAR